MVSAQISIDLGSLSGELMRGGVVILLRRVLFGSIEADGGTLSLEGAVEGGSLLLMLLPDSKLGLVTRLGERGALRGVLSCGSVEGDVGSVVPGGGIVLLVHIN